MDKYLMIEKPIAKKSFHLAGIIPVSGQSLDYDFPWHPSLMPLDNGYSLIHRAIVECAAAGCETIWVIANNDIAPLLKSQIGDYIHDPVYYYRSQDPIPTERQIEIPIFFTPISSKDRGKRDSFGWSIIHGAYTSYLVSKQLSKWVIPDKFYVAFPYGVYDPMTVQPMRKLISSESNFAVRHKGKTIKDDEFLGFTFGQRDFINCRAHVRSEGTGMYDPSGERQGGIPKTLLPPEQRWSARHFQLSKVFCKVSDDMIKYLDVDDYFCVDSWKRYQAYMADDFSVSKPEHNWFSISTYKKSLLGFNDE